jgi:hypothetical protein
MYSAVFSADSVFVALGGKKLQPFFRLRPAAEPLAVNYYIISIISFPRVRLSAVWALRKNAHTLLFVFTDENNRAAKKSTSATKKCSLK